MTSPTRVMVDVNTNTYEVTMKKTVSCLFLGVAMILAWPSQAATVKTVSIRSRKMNKDIPAMVILPDSYEKSKANYPVLYLLHGAGGNYRNWPDNLDVEELADKYDIVMCCPDGDKTSWYFDSPIDPGSQYETFTAKECVEYMDKKFRTVANRSRRAICGLSMGGHGALFLAIRHTDTFSAAVGLSAGVDIRPFPNHWGIKARIGDITTHRDNWEKLTVINVAKDLKNGELAISLDCGKSDFFLGVNRKLHEQLKQKGVQHEYSEHPGRHSWKYWNKAIVRQMPFIARQLSVDFSEGRKKKADKASKPKPRTRVVRRRRPTKEGMKRFEAMLCVRLREYLKSGRTLKFNYARLRTPVHIEGLDDDGVLSIRGTRVPISAAVSLATLGLEEKKSLALEILEQGRADDHAVAAFYLIATGNKPDAEPHLLLADEDHGVLAAFEEVGTGK